MTEIKLFCDHCGKEITNDDVKFHRNDVDGYVDLCVDCNSILNEMIEKFNNEIRLFVAGAKNGCNTSK